MDRSANRLQNAPLVQLAVATVMLVLSFCCLPGAALAQSAATGAQIVGQVLDTSGAAISGAEVTVRNKETNYSRTVSTDGAGRYTIPQLPVGPYEVKTKASGFEPAAQEVLLTLGSSISANFNLTVGSASEVVEVSA